MTDLQLYKNILLCPRNVNQGDKIGRFFATWKIVYFGCFLKITEEAIIFALIFFPPKMVWATFWPNISQTHLVTPMPTSN
jgi:hypothetical protein